MNKKVYQFFALAALAAVTLPLAASASPNYPTVVAEGEFDGRFYRVVAVNGITWQEAYALAEQSSYEGVNGHLATLTSAAEDAYVDTLRRRGNLDRPETWVGGKTNSDCEPVPGCGWSWINSEGPISTPQVPLESYSNWLQGEPNNLGEGEQHLTVGLFDGFVWNDEGNLDLIGGYIVEYDTSRPVDPQECAGDKGCRTTTGQEIRLPPGAVGANATVGIRTYEFMDDPARCGVEPLVLFDDDADPANDLIIPPYLCGSPRFIIVQVKNENVNIRRGTVTIENEVTDALPGNLYECTGPIDPDGLLSLADTLDPQHRDRVTYQRDNPAEMLENDLGQTVDPMFAGAMTEMTNECGSSRGKVMTFSYYGIGLSINFGEGYDLESNPDANHERFAALTRYKLLLLQAAVVEAFQKGAIDSGEYRALSFPIRSALTQHDRKQYAYALRAVQIFLRTSATRVSYDLVADENFSGEHEARASNIEFMYTESVIPFQ